MSSAIGSGLTGMTPVHCIDGRAGDRELAVRATTPADVRRAVLTARSSGLRVAVRATGHGTFAGPSPDTLLIDSRGSFLNFLKDTSRTRDAYTTADLARLLELKRAYDPDDLFGVGHGIGQAFAAGATRYRAAA